MRYSENYNIMVTLLFFLTDILQIVFRYLRIYVTLHVI